MTGSDNIQDTDTLSMNHSCSMIYVVFIRVLCVVRAIMGPLEHPLACGDGATQMACLPYLLYLESRCVTHPMDDLSCTDCMMQHIPGNRQLGKCPPHGRKMLALNTKTRITLVLRPFAVLPVTYDLFSTL